MNCGTVSCASCCSNFCLKQSKRDWAVASGASCVWPCPGCGSVESYTSMSGPPAESTTSTPPEEASFGKQPAPASTTRNGRRNPGVVPRSDLRNFATTRWVSSGVRSSSVSGTTPAIASPKLNHEMPCFSAWSNRKPAAGQVTE